MSIIGVKGIPPKWHLGHVDKILAKPINGQFEALNFMKKGKTRFKTCYLRLSEKLDPVVVVESINGHKYGGPLVLTAYIPASVPNLPLALSQKKHVNLRRHYRTPDEQLPHQVLPIAHMEIMTELQSKYSGLYVLSKKTSHELLEEIGRKILVRLKEIVDRVSEQYTSSLNLTKCYRRTHPHFGDFQLVLSTLHSIQDVAAQPRAQLLESELSAVSAHPYTIDNLPFEKVRQACNKYSERINKKVMEHVKNLKTEINEVDTQEEIARKKVREEIKKMSPYLPMMIKQVIAKHFVPYKTPYLRIRLYGEPFLPAKETMAPLLRSNGAVHLFRSTRMYNLMKCNIPPARYSVFRAMDGTVISGAKLVIRSSDTPLYKVSAELRAEIWALTGAPEDCDIMDEDPQEDLEEEDEA